ncbi:MAG: TonB-dependent receptor plug domain-containing protein [Myxococcaceae bacterium]
MGPHKALVLGVVLLTPLTASAYEGARREQIDAGVHVPVLTAPPQLIDFVQADFPPEAARQGVKADVKLRVTIAADGTVPEASVQSVELSGVGSGADALSLVSDAGSQFSGTSDAVTDPRGDDLRAAFAEAATAALLRFRFTPAEVDNVPAPVQIEYLYHFTLEEKPVEKPVEAAPQSTLKGEVVARGSRTRVQGATVRCGDAEDAAEAVTDLGGRFELKVPAGECKVRVVASSFELFQSTELLEGGVTTEVVFYVMPKAVGYETVVRGKREKKEVVRRTVDRQEMQRIPGTLGDPMRVIQNFPGVARQPFLGGQLIVRGAAPNQTKTYLDGVEVPLLFHLGGGPSVVNSEFLDRIDFYPGGFGAKYGRAVGGAVDVGTRKGAKDTWHGSGKIDFLDTGIFLEAPVAKGVSVAGAVRRSYVDALIPLVLPKDPEGGTLLVLPRYWDYQVRVDMGTPPKNKDEPSSTGYVMAFGSDDILKVVATGGGRNRDLSLDFHTLFHRVKGDWTFRQGALTSVLTPFLGYDLGGVSFGSASLKADRYAMGVREDLSLEFTQWLTVRAGADIVFEHAVGTAQIPVLDGTQYVGFPGADPKTALQDLRSVLNTFDGALYLETDFKIGRLTITPGLRASYARIRGVDRKAADPRFWIRFQATDNTQLKGSAGLYTQPPEATDMEQPPFGNPNLFHQKAFQTSVGLEQRFSEAITLDVTGFFNRRYDLVVPPGPRIVNADMSVTDYRFGNLGVGKAYGMEVMLRHAVTEKFFGWLAYTLNRSEQKHANDANYVLTTYDQTHILTLVGSYRLPLGFEVGARFRYVTGRPTTPRSRPYDLYAVDANSYASVIGEPLSSRFKPFHQLDLRVDKSFVFKSWTLGVYLDIQNIYNAQNVEATLYDYRVRQAIDVPGIPFLPVLGVKGSF